MNRLVAGWKIQKRVVTALMIRELTTRFGRENIGFLWIMAEPLLFAGLVSLIWRITRGTEEHGVSIVAFIISGYIPLTLFRQSIFRSTKVFYVNGSLLYHRQIKLLDFILVRFIIEVLGAMIAYAFIGLALIPFGLFPVPADMGLLLMGWVLYCLFSLSVCLVIAPLSEMSELIEKLTPVAIYITIPFSGTFSMASWLAPNARYYLLFSPPVNAMEMMRAGLFGDSVTPYYSVSVPIVFSVLCSAIGLVLCRRVRRILVVE